MLQIQFSDNTREKIDLLVKIAQSLDFHHIKTEYIAEKEEENDWELFLLNKEQEVKESFEKINNFIKTMRPYGYITIGKETDEQTEMVRKLNDISNFIEKYIKRGSSLKNRKQCEQ